MEMIMATGLMFSFLHTASPTGATMSTVATLSIKAEMRPAKRDMLIVTHMTLGHLSSRISAIKLGILEAIKKSTRIIVPVIIRRTFQLITERRLEKGRIPAIRKISPVPSA